VCAASGRFDDLMEFSDAWERFGPPTILGVGVGIAAVAIVKAMRQPGNRPSNRPSDLTSKLQKVAGIIGADDVFVPASLAVMRRESRFNPRAVNDSSSERAHACELFAASQEIYGANPAGADGFCWGSGGLCGFLPATGCKPKVFRNLDPRTVMFEVPATLAMWADYVSRIVSNYFENLPAGQRNWLSIRRSMASLTTMYDGAKSQRGREVEARYAADLSAVGADPDLMYDRVVLGHYPGAAAVWSALS